MQPEAMNFDVLIIGAGPAGLSAAIRLAQQYQEKKETCSIAVIEKGMTVGAHILSGAVLEPTALTELFPDWKERGAPLTVPVASDKFYFLTQKKAVRLPCLPKMKNHGNFIISLGNLCQWLADQAAQLGVSVLPGFCASNVLFNKNNEVVGIQTDTRGLDSSGNPTSRYQPGMHLYAKQTIFAEGCRGFLSEQLIKHFNLRSPQKPQSYAIGIKELWKINPKKHHRGQVLHTLGWPLDRSTYGGSFLYHQDDHLLSLGLAIGLDYANPYLDPFLELQRFKTHPFIKPLLEGGQCIGYGARALNEGGFQAIPRLTFPGGLLIGCAAGFLDVAKIKGIHNAMRSGMLAAEVLSKQTLASGHRYLDYERTMQNSSIYRELFSSRNIRPAFHKGLWLGMLYTVFDQYILKGKAPWTFNYRPDHLNLSKASSRLKIDYPKPDNRITFDKLTQVYLTGVSSRDNEPSHLILKQPTLAIDVNLQQYDSPEQRYCPTGVYEITYITKQPRLQINAANCIHCKTCDIKDPRQNIVWTTPEGGDGPRYSFM